MSNTLEMFVVLKLYNDSPDLIVVDINFFLCDIVRLGLQVPHSTQLLHYKIFIQYILITCILPRV